MDDSSYEDWKDNFTKNQVISAFFCGLILNLITVALFAQILRLYAYNEEKKNLTYLMRSQLPFNKSPNESINLKEWVNN